MELGRKAPWMVYLPATECYRQKNIGQLPMADGNLSLNFAQRCT